MWWNADILLSVEFQVLDYFVFVYFSLPHNVGNVCKLFLSCPITPNTLKHQAARYTSCSSLLYLPAYYYRYLISPKYVMASLFTGVSETILDTYYHQMRSWKVWNTVWVSQSSNQYDYLGYLGRPDTLRFCELP